MSPVHPSVTTRPHDPTGQTFQEVSGRNTETRRLYDQIDYQAQGQLFESHYTTESVADSYSSQGNKTEATCSWRMNRKCLSKLSIHFCVMTTGFLVLLAPDHHPLMYKSHWEAHWDTLITGGLKTDPIIRTLVGEGGYSFPKWCWNLSFGFCFSKLELRFSGNNSDSGHAPYSRLGVPRFPGSQNSCLFGLVVTSFGLEAKLQQKLVFTFVCQHVDIVVWIEKNISNHWSSVYTRSEWCFMLSWLFAYLLVVEFLSFIWRHPCHQFY